MTTKAFDKKLQPTEKKHLVIGAPGVIGRQVVRQMAGRNWPVRAMRRWDSSTTGLDFDGVDIVVGDIFDDRALDEAIAGVNAVIYCAAPSVDSDAGSVLRRSVEGIRTVLSTCRDHGVERLVLTSSASTLGRGAPGTRLDESSLYLPGSSDDPFAEAKYAVEQECFRFVADGFPVVIVNPTLVVGPGVDLNAYARLDVDKRQPLNVVDVRTVAAALVQAVIRGQSGQRYVVGGKNTTAGEVFEGWPGRADKGLRPREAYLVECGQWVDATKARRELGVEDQPS